MSKSLAQARQNLKNAYNEWKYFNGMEELANASGFRGAVVGQRFLRAKTKAIINLAAANAAVKKAGTLKRKRSVRKPK